MPKNERGEFDELRIYDHVHGQYVYGPVDWWNYNVFVKFLKNRSREILPIPPSH